VQFVIHYQPPEDIEAGGHLWLLFAYSQFEQVNRHAVPSLGVGEWRAKNHIEPMIRPRNTAPDSAEMEAMAHEALNGLPEPFRDHVQDVVVRIAEFATAEQLAAVGLDDPWDLSGLYEGRPLPERSIWDVGEMPAIVTLFRQPLLDEWRSTGVELEALIAHVVIHEIGHHFGFSDDTMHRLEDGEEF
jgi:predicted Zn-dependent protease with MMP-like domain